MTNQEKGEILTNEIRKIVGKEVMDVARSEVENLDGYEIDSINVDTYRDRIKEIEDTFSVEDTNSYLLRDGWYIANWKVEEICGKYRLDIRIELEYFVD